MKDNETSRETSVGEMNKKRELMADGRRYIIYYTFEKNAETSVRVPENAKSKTSTLNDGTSSPTAEKTGDMKSKTEERENV